MNLQEKEGTINTVGVHKKVRGNVIQVTDNELVFRKMERGAWVAR